MFKQIVWLPPAECRYCNHAYFPVSQEVLTLKQGILL
jgi:hypothetical protein